MKQLIDDGHFDDMRSEGLLVVDLEGNKLGVAANTSGDVLVIAKEFGDNFAFAICPEQIENFCGALMVAARKAKAIQGRISSEVDAHLAIKKAMNP